MERWISGYHVDVSKPPGIVINQVKIVSFPWIVSQPEITNKFIFCVYVLDKYRCREFGAEHELCLHIDCMDVEYVVSHSVREGKMIEIIPGGKNKAG